MAKVQVPQMLTANRLKDGDVIYWKAGAWVEAMANADLFVEAKDADAALAASARDVDNNTVVNPYLFEVKTEGGRIRPVKEREIIRAAGPTIRTDTGKQATESAA